MSIDHLFYRKPQQNNTERLRPLTDEERAQRDAEIEDHIAKHGVTKCPPAASGKLPHHDDKIADKMAERRKHRGLPNPKGYTAPKKDI